MDSVFSELFLQHQQAVDLIQEQIPILMQIVAMVRNAHESDGALLLMGNGGSAADAQHIAAELVGRFLKERRALPAIALTTDTSILTAVGNDYGFSQIYSRQIEGIARRNDVVLGISTSGNSENILRGIEAAKRRGCHTVGLTGQPGRLAEMVDLHIGIPGFPTARVQEAHIFIGHMLCELLDD
jgi:D-sedoheptulose 7-phosphate isomerase